MQFNLDLTLEIYTEKHHINESKNTYKRQEVSTVCLKSNDCVIDNHIYQLQFYICITGFVSRAVWILCNVYFPVLEVTHVLVCLQLRDAFSCECFPYFNFQDMLSLKSDFLVSHLLWIILSTHMFSRFALYILFLFVMCLFVVHFLTAFV